MILRKDAIYFCMQLQTADSVYLKISAVGFGCVLKVEIDR